jgi:hypothetical protein
MFMASNILPTSTPPAQPALPSTAGIVQITLTDDQRAQLAPLITQAAIKM